MPQLQVEHPWWVFDVKFFRYRTCSFPEHRLEPSSHRCYVWLRFAGPRFSCVHCWLELCWQCEQEVRLAAAVHACHNRLFPRQHLLIPAPRLAGQVSSRKVKFDEHDAAAHTMQIFFHDSVLW